MQVACGRVPFFIVGAPVVASTDELPTGCADVVEGAFAIPNLADVASLDPVTKNGDDA